jgi:hypothetical protein
MENHIVTEHHGHQQVFWQRMGRTPTFKYVFNPTSHDEFYDLEKDPSETTNILEKAPQDKLALARQTLLAWMGKTGDEPLLRSVYPILARKPVLN